MQIAVLVALAFSGVAAAVYVLANQSSGLPSIASDNYRIRAEFSLANGVRPAVGQPVSVAGVRVGQIAGLTNASSGNAILDLEISRKQLPSVYADARAHLEPITPLKDLLINLDPGTPPAGKLPNDGIIGIESTVPPTELSALLSTLDADTRSFLTMLISSLDEGTRGAGGGLRRALVALGPTTTQARRLSRALAGRRAELARAIHNLAAVTDAAASDGRLSAVVQAGNATLEAVASEDRSLRASVARLPRSLALTDRLLQQTAAFADELGPALEALGPAVERLPEALDGIRGLANTVTPVLRDDLRPFVREARPLARDLSSALPALNRVAPNATNALQSLTYLLNVMAYNPPGSDEGGLFWFSWFAHNWLYFVGSIGDAHGNIARAVPFVACDVTDAALAEVQTVVTALSGLTGLCP